MKRLVWVFAPILVWWLMVPPAHAQKALHIYIGAPGQQDVALALPKPRGGVPGGEEFWAVVKRDLELSGWFEVIDPDAYIEAQSAGLEPGQFNFDDWDVPGAMALAKTGLATRGDKIRGEVWVYDVQGRRKLGAKAFTTDPGAIRTLAHRVAGEIIFQVTGQHAPFNTRFAVSGKFGGNKEIYVVDFDGHGLTRITRNGSINLQPTWNNAGTALAFTSYAAGNPDTYIADLLQGKIRRLSARSGVNTGAMFSPGGEQLALTLSPTGDPDLYTINSQSGALVRRLTHKPGIDTSAAWSPDGSRIAFVSERGGGAQVYVMNTDGSGVRRVTFQGGHNTDPAWSPDGQSLAFVGRDRAFDVFTVRADGSGLRRITQHAGDNEDPSWSPDGNYIGFSSTRTGASHIWMSTVDGGHQVQLTQGQGGYTNPHWSPLLSW